MLVGSIDHQISPFRNRAQVSMLWADSGGSGAAQAQGQVLGQHTWELAKERLAARSQVSTPRMVRARSYSMTGV